MGKEKRLGSTEDIFAAPIVDVEELRAGISRSVAPGTAIAAGNQAILAKKKRTILYKNGYTLPGMAAALLAAEAVSGIKHSTKLGSNIRKADPGTKRPSETDAHHVVAAEASGAHVSRMMIFAVGIGINDPDNGVLLPRYKATKIASMPNASPHQHIHTDMYYANVVTELVSADDKSDSTEIRGILRSISRRLVQGQFVYC
jgi:A nuclease family of the HNH/ENDO VII superfamily with conserved AHH